MTAATARFDYYTALVHHFQRGGFDQPEILGPLAKGFLEQRPPNEHIEHIAKWLDYVGAPESAAAIRSWVHRRGAWALSDPSKTSRPPRRASASGEAVEHEQANTEVDVVDTAAASSSPAPSIFNLRDEDVPLLTSVPLGERRAQLESETQSASVHAHQLHRNQIGRTDERERFAHTNARIGVGLNQLKLATAVENFANAPHERRRQERREAHKQDMERRNMALKEAAAKKVNWLAVLGGVSTVVTTGLVINKMMKE